MALTYWANKTCGNCKVVSPNDLPIYHCETCDTDKCPSCAGCQSTTGTIPMCRTCGTELIPDLFGGRDTPQQA
jgi:hypothetical protein